MSLPDCSAHDDCTDVVFLLLRDLPVCRKGYDEMGGIL